MTEKSTGGWKKDGLFWHGAIHLNRLLLGLTERRIGNVDSNLLFDSLMANIYLIHLFQGSSSTIHKGGTV